jgi:hypothetical protein
MGVANNEYRKLVAVFRIMLAALFLLALSAVASAQCVQNPTGETAVGLQNASSYYLIFYIDGVNKGGVPPGDKSVDFVIKPGEHTFRADARIGGETVSAQRTATIPEGYVCTWTVTDPPPASSVNKERSDEGRSAFRDSLCRK